MSALIQSEISKSVFKHVCLLFLPGALITIPLIILLYLGTTHPGIIYSGEIANQCLNLIDYNKPFFYLIGFILSPLMGFVLENIGSLIEKYLDKKNDIDGKAWDSYLLSNYCEKKDKIIFKYIDSVVFRYKMELSLIPALFFFSIEWFLIYINDDAVLPCDIFYSVLIIVLGIFLFTLQQANYSCKVLDDLRILLGVDK